MTISRRDFLQATGAAALWGGRSAGADEPGVPDYELEIVPVTVDLSPSHRLRTMAYNGQVPGPLLRVKENRKVTIEVTNRSDRPEVVHWHGLFLPPSVDGAMEEGTPSIAPNATARYTFEPRPAGFRWYHTHTMAMGDLTRAQYSGQHGFLSIERGDEPGLYDQEFFLALHDWDGHLLASDDGAMNPTYKVSTINGRILGFGEPLPVRQGQRVMLHILNSSPTESYPDVVAAPLRKGRRYRLQLINASQDDHPIHLHRHSFKLCRRSVPLENGNSWTPATQSIHGIMKDVVLVDARTVREVEFTADNPGPTLFHCHQQNHMDLGFMMLFNYA